MIPKRSTILETTETTSNDLGGFDQQFDPAGYGHIMSMLAEQYSDPYTAAIREYTANAIDSHVEAGQTRPVEITLPTKLEPTLVIRDYGIGMDESQLEKIYGQWGLSTKQDNEQAVGYFGIGSKVGYALSRSFMVTTVQDHKKWISTFTKKDNGIGRTNYHMRGDYTTDGNGVTISIPVEPDQIGNSNDVIKTLRWFPEGSILLDGEPVPTPQVEEEISTERYRVLKDNNSYYGSELFVVMGGIQYSIPTSMRHDINEALFERDITLVNHDAAIIVDNGDLMLVPSRESIVNDKSSTETIVEYLYQELVILKEKVKKELDSNNSCILDYIYGRNSLDNYRFWLLNGKQNKYGSHNIELPKVFYGILRSQANSNSFPMRSPMETSKINVQMLSSNISSRENTIAIIASPSDYSRLTRHRKAFYGDDDFKSAIVLSAPVHIRGLIIDPNDPKSHIKAMTADEFVTEYPLPHRASKKSGPKNYDDHLWRVYTPSSSYYGSASDRYEKEKDIRGKVMVYHHGNAKSLPDNINFLKIEVVLIPKNYKIDKVLERNPNWITVDQRIKELVSENLDRLTEFKKETWARRKTNSYQFPTLNNEYFDSFNKSSYDLPYTERYFLNNLSGYAEHHNLIDEELYNKWDKDFEDLFKHYPLLRHLKESTPDEVVEEYINGSKEGLEFLNSFV